MKHLIKINEDTLHVNPIIINFAGEYVKKIDMVTHEPNSTTYTFSFRIENAKDLCAINVLITKYPTLMVQEVMKEDKTIYTKFNKTVIHQLYIDVTFNIIDLITMYTKSKNIKIRSIELFMDKEYVIIDTEPHNIHDVDIYTILNYLYEKTKILPMCSINKDVDEVCYGDILLRHSIKTSVCLHADVNNIVIEKYLKNITDILGLKVKYNPGVHFNLIYTEPVQVSIDINELNSLVEKIINIYKFK